MPKELVRKRGRRGNKKSKDQDATEPQPTASTSTSTAQASGIHPSRLAALEGRAYVPAPGEEEPKTEYHTPQDNGGVDPAAPFGFVEPDVKAYFKSVDEKLREWEEIGLPSGEAGKEELDDRTSFLQASLTELRSQELQLATDTDCALIMERMMASMGDWGRRVLGDSFSGSWSTLLQHRFGSHVCQTLFSLSAETIDRETRNVFPKQHKQQLENAEKDSSVGQLRTMTQLILDLCEEVLPTLPQLLTSPFASPPIRLLLLLLSRGRPIPSPASSADAADKRIRSKRSAKYRAHQAGGMTSILGSDGLKAEGLDVEAEVDSGADAEERGRGKNRKMPSEFGQMRRKVREDLGERLGGGEWRAMGVESVGGPVVQILLEIEAEDGACEVEGSILDHVTSGLISEELAGTEPIATDFIPSLLRDTTGSHLLQSILLSSPPKSFAHLWALYFLGKIGKLASHPIGNYVVATGVGRLDAEGVKVVLAELEAVGVSTLIKTSRTAVLKSLVDHAKSTKIMEKEVAGTTLKAFELETYPEKKLLVPCAMSLNVLKMYRKALAEANGETVESDEEPDAEAEQPQHGWKPRQPKREKKPLEPNMQGALLLQSILGLSSPANDTVLDSLTSLPLDQLLAMAHHPISSHVIDAALISESVSPKWRRKLMMAFLGSYTKLVDDKFGSRVGDTIWDKADGFMKEKIARSLIPEAFTLSSSQYGRFFARKLSLQLLERRPDEWREAQLGLKHHFAHQKAAEATAVVGGEADGDGEGKKKRKRNKEAGMEELEADTRVIDELFEPVLKEKKRKIKL